LQKVFSYQLDQLSQIAEELLGSFTHKTVLFRGEMGSGKTTLIKKILEAMETLDKVQSPSFSLVNEYHTKAGTVFHFDLYRIEDPNEIWDLGFEDYLTCNDWLFIEWPEQIIDILPSGFDIVDIKIKSELSRSLKLTIDKEVLT
jgi:tRNA threonylcarbamoyladenosine biosynthesis protein TsaE